MAAKTKISSTSMFVRKHKVKRPGIHAKSKTSLSKHSKNYIKQYAGQGK